MAKITVMNTLNGQTDVVNERLLENPTFAAHYIEVPEGTKPYHADFYKPRTADEFREDKPEKVSRRSAIKVAEPVDEATPIFDEAVATNTEEGK